MGCVFRKYYIKNILLLLILKHTLSLKMFDDIALYAKDKCEINILKLFMDVWYIIIEETNMCSFLNKQEFGFIMREYLISVRILKLFPVFYFI